MGGADPAEPERPRDAPAGPGDAARERGPTGPGATERPAPRDQPDADPATPLAAGPAGPAGPLVAERGGRSSGGATRLPPLSASGAFLLRAAPPAPLITRREPGLASPSPSAGGGASGRSREAYASLDALATVPAEAADPAAAPALAPLATPAATAAAWPGFRRAHRAAR
jgi:hypothetical protein